MKKNISFGVILSLSFLLTSTTFASTIASPVISGNEVWTKANSPYIVAGVYIPLGASLTIEPGTVVKILLNANPFTIEGRLNMGSASAEQVTLTSINDDTVGGDSNGDGTATTPAAGDWNKITMNAGAQVNIQNTTITYGGANPYDAFTGGHFNYPMIENNGGILSINNSVFSNSGYYGILQNSGSTTITNSTFSNMARLGVTVARGYMNVASSTFDNMQYGIFVSTGTLELASNTFSHLINSAVYLNGSPIIFRNHGGNIGTTGFLFGLDFQV